MPTWSAHISMLYAERPYAERIGLARDAGFGWVESWWPESQADRDALAAATGQGVRVALLNTDGGDRSRGERGFLCDPRDEERGRRTFLDGVDLAARAGARSLHAMVGCGAGTRARDHAGGMLRELVPEATARGIAVVVEALNPHDAPGYLTPTPEAVVALVDGIDGCGLLLDAYHMLRSGRDPAAEARRAAGAIGHVHVADCPGRRPPGTGALDLEGFLAALDDAGYDGPVGLEYDAAGDTAGSLVFLRARER
jgi:hydroxypyruvate isomerase